MQQIIGNDLPEDEPTISGQSEIVIENGGDETLSEAHKAEIRQLAL